MAGVTMFYTTRWPLFMRNSSAIRLEMLPKIKKPLTTEPFSQKPSQPE